MTDRLWDQHYLLAAVMATQVSTAWNLLWTELFVFSGAKPGSQLSRGIKFFLLNNVALLVRIPLLALLVDGFWSVNLLVANVFTLVLLFLVRFVIADAAIYARPAHGGRQAADADCGDPGRAGADRPPGSTGRPRPGHRHLPYRYAIHDLLTIGSHVPSARAGVLPGAVGRATTST